MSFFDSIKNILLILLFLHLAPGLIEGIRSQYGRILEPQTSVGVLKIKGILYDSAHYNKYLDQYFKNKEIKAILLKIECPGGASGTAHAIAHELLTLKKEYPKPVIALVENMCASGGYMIACVCDHIIASGSATIGSIGSSLPYLFQLQEFLAKYTINYVPLSAGTHKNATNPLVDLTEKEQAMLQDMVNDSYDQFAQLVAEQRKLSLHNKTAWAEGKLFTARQAIKLGLIDELGSAQDAIRIIKEKALIENEIEWIKPPQATGLARIFGGDDTGENTLFTSFANTFCSVVESRLFAPSQTIR